MDKLETRVFGAIESGRDRTVKLLQKLLRIDTQVPPGHDYDKVCGVLEERYNHLGYATSLHEATEKYMRLSGARHIGLEGPRTNLVARLKGTGGGPTLHISAHTDTAAIQKQGWSVDPLGGEVTKTSKYGKSAFDRGGGYIWGRGVGDDKGETAALLLALEAIKEAGVRLRGDLVVTANCDEEIGGVAGLGYLIREGIVKADLGIQLDGSMTGIGLSAMGRTRFLVRTRGKSYHGQVPIMGVNAIEKMSKLNVALDDYWRNVLLRRKYPTPGIDFGEGLREKGIECPTGMLNIGTIRGGVQGATVPDLCEEEVLRGMIPGETYEGTQAEFRTVLDGVKATDADLQYELETINFREGYVVPATDPYALECRALIQEAVGKKLPFTGTLASTDMNYQVVDGHMPCVNFGVGGPYSNGHGQDENASIDELVECAKAVALITMRKLGVQ
ncbi:MAG: M20/M25/M40 family metallo-hydrolase [Candidatus Bathyarchaeota archaeon]|nr:M20/M25/M40 family metallo-hydrolase [Candidatus Bathyarchaeota archaeon]